MNLLTLLVPNQLYIDPAATSILLTSLSGIVIAVGATAVILWRKVRKSAAKVLKIDENANKIVEDDVVFTDEDAEKTDAEKAEAPAAAAASEEKKD